LGPDPFPDDPERAELLLVRLAADGVRLAAEEVRLAAAAGFADFGR
jgi:hypothetical protein